MATGDINNMRSRLRTMLPPWFGDVTNSPLLDGVLTGLAAAHSGVYGLVQCARLQTRIASATGGFLEMIAWDFFAGRMVRKTGESDAAFSARLRAEIIRPRATRASVVEVLQQLTTNSSYPDGRTPVIFEPTRPADTGAYGVKASIGYGKAGGYGSLLLPNQAFIVAYRPSTSGIPLINGYGQPAGAYATRYPLVPGAGYGSPSGGYRVGAIAYVRRKWSPYQGTGQGAYADVSQVIGAVTDADLYTAIDSVKPVASTLWTRLSN